MGGLIDLLPLEYAESVVVIGSAIIGLCAGVLGALAVLRQRSLVGDALSHAALPGVAVAFLVTGARDAGSLLVGAAIAGLLAALAMVAVERTSRLRPDAAIGVVLSSFFSLGIVLLTFIANGDDADQAGLDTYLFGQAAGLLERDLTIMAALCVASIAVVALGFRALKTALFDGSFGAAAGLPVRALDVGMTLLLVVAVVVGVRAVGAILMVALLIAPGVAARQFAGRLALMLPLAGLLGAGIGVAGGLLANAAEVPTGPVIVLVGFAVALAAILFAPGRGVLWRARALAHARRVRRREALLVDLERAMHAGPPPSEAELVLATGRGRGELRRGLRELRRDGLLEHGERLVLTEAGAAAAHALLERRELWSAWIAHGHRLGITDAREPDPSDLTRTLTPAELERLRELSAS